MLKWTSETRMIQRNTDWPVGQRLARSPENFANVNISESAQEDIGNPVRFGDTIHIKNDLTGNRLLLASFRDFLHLARQGNRYRANPIRYPKAMDRLLVVKNGEVLLLAR